MAGSYYGAPPPTTASNPQYSSAGGGGLAGDNGQQVESPWKNFFDNPIANFFLGDQSAGYKTAAQGAALASQGYAQLAQDQWNQAMYGLGEANNAYAPSNALWSSLYGSRGPSALDSWWTQNQGAFGDQTQGDRALQDFRSYMGQPTSSGSAYTNAMSALGGYGTGTQDFYNRFGNQLQQRSAAEQAYNPGAYATPGRAEDFAQFAESRLGGNGAAENLRWQDVGNVQNFAQSLAGRQGIGQTNEMAGELGGYYRGANDVSNYAAGQMGALQGPGAYEQFVTQDINGTNPELERATNQGLARINQEMARRGAFSSGAADTSIGNFLGEQAAADYQNRAQRAQQAQQMQLGRIGAGQSLAQASAQGQLAQGQALQGLAGQQDTETMSRLGQQLQAQQGASSEALANNQGRLNYAQAADQSALARTQALGQLEGQAQQMQLARLAAGMGAAGQSDQGQLARLAAGYGMAQGADAAQLARAQGLYGMAQGTDAANMARYGMLGQLSGQQDQAALARLLGAGGLAGQVTQADQNALNAMFAQRFGIDQGISGNIGNFYGMGMNAYGQDSGDALNALANYYQLLGLGQNANNPMERAGVALKAYNAGK
jgi:hypothetical protein